MTRGCVVPSLTASATAVPKTGASTSARVTLGLQFLVIHLTALSHDVKLPPTATSRSSAHEVTRWPSTCHAM